MTDREADQKRLSDAVNTLTEHFDSVQIICTRYDPATEGGTVTVDEGGGNWFARVGSVKRWLVWQDERERIDCRKREGEE